MLELVEKDTTNYLGIPLEQIPESTRGWGYTAKNNTKSCIKLLEVFKVINQLCEYRRELMKLDGVNYT